MMNPFSSSKTSSMSGILLLVAASVFWSLNGALIKLIHQQGQGPDGITIAFFRSLVAGLFLLPLAYGKLHTLAKDRTPQPANPSSATSLFTLPAVLFRMRPAALCCPVFFTLMTACFVLANTITEAANVIILQYTSTFWVFGLSPWLLKEKPKLDDLGILGLAMGGIAVIFVGNASTSLPGLSIALASGVFFALLTMMIRLMRDSDSAAVMAANNLGSALLLFPAVLLVGTLTLSGRSWGLLILMGVVQFGLPYYLYTLGLARIPAYQAMLLTLLEPILVPIWTYLAVGETVPPTTLAGGGLILAALLLFIHTAQKKTGRLPPASPSDEESSVASQ